MELEFLWEGFSWTSSVNDNKNAVEKRGHSGLGKEVTDREARPQNNQQVTNQLPFSQRLQVCKEHHSRNHLTSLGLSKPVSKTRLILHLLFGQSLLSHVSSHVLETSAAVYIPAISGNTDQNHCISLKLAHKIPGYFQRYHLLPASPASSPVYSSCSILHYCKGLEQVGQEQLMGLLPASWRSVQNTKFKSFISYRSSVYALCQELSQKRMLR